MNCRQTSQLLSEALDRALTHEEQDEIERHLAICPPCANCRKQFQELRRALRRFAYPG
ncbi:MAG TPA: zf-HC2 domain-containing protein [Candidatus Eisenbacteria bacterium]